MTERRPRLLIRAASGSGPVVLCYSPTAVRDAITILLDLGFVDVLCTSAVSLDRRRKAAKSQHSLSPGLNVLATGSPAAGGVPAAAGK